ncbi:MAG: histone deacetylase family protein [Hyphomicrobiaceae bacterium]|nr:histone deacetylase family protein [Hyphomicrobiaceae bacterium]
MPTLLLTHPCFVDHDTGYGHPERPDRMRVIDRVLEHELFQALHREEAPLRDDVEQQILLAHPASHLELVRKSRPSKEGDQVRLDPDTVMSPGSWQAALRAVGAGLEAVDRVMDPKSGNRNAFCQVRPCGHHAEANRAMGFCLFSNVAIAALYARARHGAERVAVVDFDVHHGNGTQDIFETDKDMFFGSTHQMPLYPGTGALSETGVGNVWNAPLRSGDGGSAFREAMESRILPALRNFSPDIILISAGFDAHRDDPLASLELVEDDFMWVTRRLVDIAEKQCDGRVVSMLEGGYDLKALARSVGVHVKTLMDAAS